MWLGAEVAVKRLRFGRGLTATDLKEFRAEVDIMARMRHVNVVQFVGACTVPPNLSILTEFLPKGSLYDVLRRERLTWPLKVKIMHQAAAGLLYLHNRKPPIVHRDLKSDNFLVASDYTVKVCDFGLARFKSAAGHVATSHNRSGTPGWMAPEVLRGEKFNECCDIYSFAIVMWELLTGECPWGDMEPAQLTSVVGFQGRRLPVPSRPPPGCPEDYLLLMTDCWQQSPSRRPKMREVQARLLEMEKRTGGR